MTTATVAMGKRVVFRYDWQRADFRRGMRWVREDYVKYLKTGDSYCHGWAVWYLARSLELVADRRVRGRLVYAFSYMIGGHKPPVRV